MPPVDSLDLPPHPLPAQSISLDVEEGIVLQAEKKTKVKISFDCKVLQSQIIPMIYVFNYMICVWQYLASDFKRKLLHLGQRNYKYEFSCGEGLEVD